ncbi:MAG TPA: DUF6089 family protein [Saprospiraceae bacterium]|nr:DUF6089 family protein [Saprospiraceae bacterium]
MKKNSLVALFVLSCAVLMQAQRGPEIGVVLGASNYFGDLNTNYSLKRLGPAGGFVVRYNFNNRLSAKLAGMYGRLQAMDSDSENSFQRSRNLSFRSAVVDASLQIEFNFFPYVHGSDQDFYTPYIFLGAGIYYANPKAKLNDTWIPLQSLGTEGQPIGGEYSLANPALAYGIGFKSDINSVWSLNIELSGRALFSDYLDDVSKTYPNLLQLQNLRGMQAALLSDRSGEVVPEPIGEPGRQRGNSKNNDAFAFLTVGLVYYLGALECPSIGRPQVKEKAKVKRR